MTYRQQISGHTYQFDGLVDVLAKATPLRSGDELAGCAAESDAERAAVMAASPVRGVYDTPVDRESAHEILTARRGEADQAEAEAKATADKAKADALDAAGAIAARGIDALVVDISARTAPEASELAQAMRARFLALPLADAAKLHAAVKATQPGALAA